MATLTRSRVHISELGHDVLRGLYAHRLLTTHQLHQLYAPDRTLRWTLMATTRLEADGFVGRVRVARTRMHAWYLTPAGVSITEGAGVEVRAYRMSHDRAAGPLQAHTLAVNEIGLAFVRAARDRGDDCGPADWRNETAHRLGPGARAEVLVSDAMLDYTAYGGAETGERVTRFVEIDRATTSVRVLAAKTEAYTRLWAYRPAWRAHARFPGLLIVMDGLSGPALERRLDALEATLRLSAAVARCDELDLYVVTLARLRRDALAPVCWQPGLDYPVDVLGQTGR